MCNVGNGIISLNGPGNNEGSNAIDQINVSTLDPNKKTCSGKNWWCLEIIELLAYLGIFLFMGIKKQSNCHSHRRRLKSFLNNKMTGNKISKSRC